MAHLVSARLRWRIAACFAALAAVCAPARAVEPPLAAVTLVGPPQTVFTPKRDACDANDVPDIPARAFRDAQGGIVLFAMHTENRALRGPDFDKLKLDCSSPLPSHGEADPAAFDDESWITATWTTDGQRVAALVHHEYQANTHPGRCGHKEYLACWYNTVLAVSSSDGGRSFTRPPRPQVVAAAPFTQEVGQGRHRGFFNPSNIVADGQAYYFFAGTTGWEGQGTGACLFRSLDPADPTSWRGYDGQGFTARFVDPYRAKPGKPTCRTIEPFPAPVGSIARHRGTGAWIAVFQASADRDLFPEAGFYTTSSRDLLAWDKPRLLLAGRTLYDDPCTSGGRLIAYPSLIDPAAAGRNFDDIGDSADLYFSDLKVEGCNVTAARDLVRRRVAIKVWP
jgi:hypothetical protein